jgi:hypothetical protein
MSTWNCGARNCPTHSRPDHRCMPGIWSCGRRQPQCSEHSSPNHQCEAGSMWHCGARNCPSHNQPEHRCGIGMWLCGRVRPLCPGHGSREHRCEAGAALLGFRQAERISQAGRLAFTQMDECGIAALDEILTISIEEGREYSGLIFQLGARFGFTRPIPGEVDSALPTIAAIQAGTTIIGTYHTHGNQHGAGEIFSPQDRGFHNLHHWIGYLGTPTGAILRLRPRDLDPNENPWLAAFGGTAEMLRPGRQ